MTSWYLTRTVIRVRREKTGVDAYGNDVYSDVPSEIEGCSFDPRSSMGSESVHAQQQTVSGVRLIVENPNVDLEATDAVVIGGMLLDGEVVGGVRYEVDGEIGRHTGSRMGNDHAEVALMKVTG